MGSILDRIEAIPRFLRGKFDNLGDSIRRDFLLHKLAGNDLTPLEWVKSTRLCLSMI